MQGLVTLDFGNSNPHAGLFSRNEKGWQLLKVVPFHELSLYLPQFGLTPDNTSLVLAEVKARGDELFSYLQQGYLLTRVKDYWRGNRFAGMPVHYAQTLGEDRLIEAYMSYRKEKASTLIIDAGTYVTLDVVNEQGFQGGFIIPGLDIYSKCFQKGEQLKGVELPSEISADLPRDTAHALIGSYSAFGALANNLVEEHKIKKVVITGGMSPLWLNFFDDSKPSLVVESDPHLIHSSLHYWFTTQIEPL